MKIHALLKVFLPFIVMLLLGGAAFYYGRTVPEKISVENAPASYRNDQYGFYFELPVGWQGYQAVSSTWSGYQMRDTTHKNLLIGPFITINDTRAPASPQDSWQNIPIMIYTLTQWDNGSGMLEQAAPVDPAELGRNNKYVFVLPARSIGFVATQGIEEVNNWLISKQFHTLNVP